MQLLLHKNVSQNFLDRLFEDTLCYPRPLLPVIIVRVDFSLQICHTHDFVNIYIYFMDEYIVGRSNVVTFHNLLNLRSRDKCMIKADICNCFKGQVGNCNPRGSNYNFLSKIVNTFTVNYCTMNTVALLVDLVTALIKRLFLLQA